MNSPVRTIGVLASGGDSSGMNPCLRGVVRAAVTAGIKVKGIYRGYQGLIEGDVSELSSRDVSGIIQRGGIILYSARCDEFMRPEGRRKAVETMRKEGMDALVVIGGDGSLTGLSLLIKEHGIRGIGLPGTMDNDLYGTDWTIGFDTAVNTAMEAIDKLRDTATSHDRLFIVEVMGRRSGYVALFSGLSSGAEAILIPETRTDLDKICRDLEEGKRKGKRSSILVVAEGDEEGGAFEIAEKIKGKTGWDTRVTVLGHIQRGGSPTAFERVNAGRMGVASIQALIDGKNSVMVGIINDEIALTPLDEAVGRKKKPCTCYLETAAILGK
jgi:6-phosphofructokinase 1